MTLFIALHGTPECEGVLTERVAFRDLHYVAQIDLLQDWMCELSKLHKETLESYREHNKAVRS